MSSFCEIEMTDILYEIQKEQGFATVIINSSINIIMVLYAIHVLS